MSLRDRGQSFENRFEQDKFLKFKVIARRNKKIGLWASKLLGISPSESERFINEIISKITHDPDDRELIRLLLLELKDHYISMSENQIRRQMSYFYQEARAEIANEN